MMTQHSSRRRSARACPGRTGRSGAANGSRNAPLCAIGSSSCQRGRHRSEPRWRRRMPAPRASGSSSGPPERRSRCGRPPAACRRRSPSGSSVRPRRRGWGSGGVRAEPATAPRAGPNDDRRIAAAPSAFAIGREPMAHSRSTTQSQSLRTAPVPGASTGTVVSSICSRSLRRNSVLIASITGASSCAALRLPPWRDDRAANRARHAGRSRWSCAGSCCCRSTPCWRRGARSRLRLVAPGAGPVPSQGRRAASGAAVGAPPLPSDAASGATASDHRPPASSSPPFGGSRAASRPATMTDTGAPGPVMPSTRRGSSA